jgi:predicted O-methyltransferase YrrM
MTNFNTFYFNIFFRDISNRVRGWLTINEAHFISHAANRVVAYQDIVEIGTYQGLSAIAMAYGSFHGDGARIYCVDPHLPSLTSDTIAYGPGDATQWRKNVMTSGLGGVISAVELPSARAAAAWPCGSIDLLFIDGDHHYHEVMTDLRCWVPKVAAGGLVCMHDREEPGVSQAITERPAELTDVGIVDSIQILLKGEESQEALSKWVR